MKLDEAAANSDPRSFRSRRGLIRILGLLFPLSALTKRVDAQGLSRLPATEDAGACGPWVGQSLATSRFVTSPVTVAGEPARAVIDSGLSRTAVASGLARTLKLPLVGSGTTKGFSGTIVTARYELSSLNIGPVGVHNLPVMGVEEAGLPLPADISVVIGCDVLERLVLDVDMPNDAMRICSSAPKVSEEYRLVRITTGPERTPAISLAIEGTTVPAAMLDTGSNAVCSIAQRYADQLGLLDGRRTSTAMTTGVDGTTTDLVTTLREMTVGGIVLRNVPATISETWTLQTPVNVGWPLLRAFRAIMDVAAGAMWLKPDARSLATPFPRDRSGIGAARLPDHLLVRHVARGSPAERAGLVAGDVVIAIDGRRIDHDFPRPGERQGYKAPGTNMDLQLSDGRHIALVLADYF